MSPSKLSIGPLNWIQRNLILGPPYALNNQGRFNESLIALNRAIELNHNEPSYYTSKARALAGLGRQDEALKAYDRAVTLNPTDPNNWINKGWALYYQGNFSDALKLFDKAIDLNPKEPRYWNARQPPLANSGTILNL
jgi:tetratricopeptide (TPR) repeat protein